MSTLKLSLVALCLFMAQLSFSQTAQMVFYFSDNLSTTYIDNLAAANGGGIVIQYPQIGGNIGIIETTFPYVSPYTGVIIVDSAIGSTHIKDEDAEVDGGIENLSLMAPENNTKPPTDPKCYNLGLYHHSKGTNPVNLGIYDSGVEYQDANLNGYNFESVIEINGPVNDENGHGTHVGGIINDYLSNNATQASVETYYIADPFDGQGSSSIGNLLIDLEYGLINHSINVWNFSFSYLSDKEGADWDPFYILLKNTENKLFVCSAGNKEMNQDDPNETLASYPSAFALPQILSVTSYNCSRGVSDFANYGALSVDIAAPGENIESIDNNMELVQMSGTSQANAFVSYTAAMLATYQPIFNAEQIKCAIINGGTYTNTLNGKILSSSVLNVEGAFLQLGNCSGTPGNPGTPLEGRSGAMLKDQLLNISPNPFSDYINIDLELIKTSPIIITMMDMSGRILSQTQYSGEIGENNLSINLQDLSAENMIFVKINTDEFSTIKKLVKIQ